MFRLPPEVNNAAVTIKYRQVISCEDKKGKVEPERALSTEFAQLKQDVHIVSYIKINRVDVLVLYDRQPPSCRKCNVAGHLFIDCPRRLKNQPEGRRWENLHGLRKKNSEQPNSSGAGVDGGQARRAALCRLLNPSLPISLAQLHRSWLPNAYRANGAERARSGPEANAEPSEPRHHGSGLGPRRSAQKKLCAP